jgi:signal transduction histidine kinase
VFELEAALQEVMALCAGEIERHGAAATVEACGTGAVIGHRETFVQAVANLVINGVKFVAPGEKARVRIWCERHGQGRWRVWVQDNGIGIAPQHQERIFHTFERLHGNETYAGTGIGLAIVRRGIERMGGQSGVESELGKGSRFWVELPAADGKTAEGGAS